MSEVALTFFAVFDKFLIKHLMARLHPRDLAQFGMVCHLTRSYYHEYIEETIVPEIRKNFMKDGKGPHLPACFLKLIQGINVEHPTPFPDVPKMTDYWKTDMSRVVVFQNMTNAQKPNPSFYIDRAPEGVTIPAKGTHPPKGVRCTCVPRAFAPEAYYHHRPPFYHSCLLKEAPIVYFTTDCILPLVGMYECWVQLYFFTDSYLPFLNVEISGSQSVVCEKIVNRIKFTDTEGRRCVGRYRTRVGIIHTEALRAHAILRLFNMDITQGPYARVAFDYVMYRPLSTPSEVTRKRKFQVLE